MHAIVGRVEQCAVDDREPGRRKRFAGGWRSAGRGTVALPPPAPAMLAIVGHEAQRAVDICQVRRVGAGPARVDVVDEGGSSGGAVALPQLPAMLAISG